MNLSAFFGVLNASVADGHHYAWPWGNSEPKLSSREALAQGASLWGSTLASNLLLGELSRFPSICMSKERAERKLTTLFLRVTPEPAGDSFCM